MAITRAAKETMITEMHEAFNTSDIVIVVHNKGLTVEQMTGLRRQIRAAGAGFKVAKNRLVKRALENTKFAGIADMFTGPTVTAYANDPVAAAKVLAQFAKDNERLVLLGGAFGERRLDADGIQALSKMPSLNELRAKIVGMLQTPASRIASILQAPGGQVARVINAHATKGEA